MRRQARFIVFVDLDDVPGTMHTEESAEQIIRNVLHQRMGHYNPQVHAIPFLPVPEDEVLPPYNMRVESIMNNWQTPEEGTN